jgi:hypothetical protein
MLKIQIMKGILFVWFLFFSTTSLIAQTCDEFMDYVKNNAYGSTFYSFNSEAISKVTFYQLYEDYETYYFAIVCFKQKYSYACNEYIYQVASTTKLNYSMSYLQSAGEAFWDYIQPYSNVLGCSPSFE